jgi:hypothetical protein
MTAFLVIPDYREIDDNIRSLRLHTVQSATSVRPESLLTLIQRLLIIYRAINPFLTALSALPLIPATWRAALTAFLQVLDAIAAVAVPVPVPASAAGDIDPINTNPDFKAGKDL